MRTFHPHDEPSLISAQAWIAPNATVLGQVEVCEDASVWYGAVIRGDVEPIRIGVSTNVQDLCCLHADPGTPCRLGDRVTVGHGAIVHGALVEDEVLIGMGAIVLNGASIGMHSIIGAGAVVTENKVIPPRSLVVGTPGKVIREVTEQEIERIRLGALHYVEASRQHRARRLAH